MNDLKVTEGMESVAWDVHPTMKQKLEDVLAHPDFRAQVAELMRGMVPEPTWRGDHFDPAESQLSQRVLDRIAEWESAK